jgi:hypothetical protein
MSSGFTSVPPTWRELLPTMYRSAQGEAQGHLRFLPFILKEDIEKFLPRLNSLRFRSQIERVGDYYLVRLKRVQLDLDETDKPVSGDFALFTIAGSVWCFCSIERSAVVNKTAIAAIQQHPSRASLIYISTREFRRIFDDLSIDGNRVLVLRHNEYNRQESNVNWLKERKDHRVVFDELASKDAVATSIVAELRSMRGGQLTAFSLNNNSLLSLRLGQVELFLETIVGQVAAIGNARNSLFQNRERSHTELHPLELTFDSGILSDKMANSALVESLSSMSKSAVAVFHSNPYVHILYTDFRDGSSFNIYSSSESTLTIVPSTRASVSALMKLYRRISERFADCDITEAQQSATTIRDLFGS